jgi:hypothetical protein
MKFESYNKKEARCFQFLGGDGSSDDVLKASVTTISLPDANPHPDSGIFFQFSPFASLPVLALLLCSEIFVAY